MEEQMLCNNCSPVPDKNPGLLKLYFLISLYHIETISSPCVERKQVYYKYVTTFKNYPGSCVKFSELIPFL